MNLKIGAHIVIKIMDPPTMIRLRNSLSQFWRNNYAGLTIEFAMTVPILVMFYIGAAEVFLAIDTNRKLNKMTATIGEVIAKLDLVTNQDVVDIFYLTNVSLFPYTSSSPTVTVSALKTREGQPTKANVVWSLRYGPDGITSPYSVDSVADLAASIGGSGPLLIKVDMKLAYKPVLGWLLPNYEMHKSYFALPRYGAAAANCADCNVP